MMSNLSDFISILEAVISCAQIEIKDISRGMKSGWTLEQLEEVVLPEINELLSYALNGRVYYKYGNKQKLLQSSYVLTESLDHLNHTTLGKRIIELQRLYNKL